MGLALRVFSLLSIVLSCSASLAQDSSSTKVKDHEQALSLAGQFPVVIIVDTTMRRMTYFSREKMETPKQITVSVGERLHRKTPQGSFQAHSLTPYWHSKMSGQSVNHAIFFSSLFIIGSSPSYNHSIGQKSTGGMVALSPDDARDLFKVARAFNANQVHIVIK
jgi:lipoprotein-anchoring transpeptidase ErfK/SrfK